jgi:hypothetical protein
VEILPFPAGDEIIIKGIYFIYVYLYIYMYIYIYVYIYRNFLFKKKIHIYIYIYIYIYIIIKGTVGNVFYLIKEGTVRITDVGDGKSFPDHNLGTCLYIYIDM